MRTPRTGLRQLEDDLGELLEAHEATTAGRDLSEYEDDPVGFIREVLDADPWRLQEEVAEAVEEEPLVTVRSCHAAGKDWLAARLALWWTYARRGLVVLTGPTGAQVEEILMRGEVREAFRGSGLSGELHVRALRPGGEEAAGILARTATGVSRMTGFHSARVLFVITEAQDPDISHAWDAGFACITGSEDRLLTLGNPTQKAGRFYRAHRPKSDWRTFQIVASDVPNVARCETVVPGLLTREGVDRFASEYGEDSGFYQSRVLAEFPEEAEGGLIRREWLEEAADPRRRGKLRDEIHGSERIAALDPARRGPDASVLAFRRGPILQELLIWRGERDTTELVEKVTSALFDRGIRPRRERLTAVERERGKSRAPTGRVVVDEVGLGGGVLDRLKDDGWAAVGYNGGRTPEESERFSNRRAEAYWTLRDRLEKGEIALPDEEELFEELLALRWRPTAGGKVQLERKEDLRSRLGRSPDRADAVAMAFAAPKRRAPPSVEPVHW